jgi:hypothetical protein
MSFTTIRSTQTAFLEKHLRGTNREMSAAQARATFGIENLRARMTEMRQAGLRVRTGVNTQGRTVYAVSRRVMLGGQFSLFQG